MLVVLPSLVFNLIADARPPAGGEILRLPPGSTRRSALLALDIAARYASAHEHTPARSRAEPTTAAFGTTDERHARYRPMQVVKTT
ncbi:hypothetical protein PsYK624_062580 [Phanerochaete sordida]|uniref:Uncharacterized protein n=1 Tax=Phanerochaete sordida TaxID=48140 RepID=A0A9P3G972_9APHY|nr:hypothetical protein PsYK624_062580 [Phanerochaete sordida]